ncbi:unnamed protein product, partial [Rotaria magnacalcarata]
AVTILDLAPNQIGMMGAKHLTNMLQTNSTLMMLNLWSNRIKDKGAEYLASVLETNKTLTALDIGSNHIGDDGAEYLAHALQTNRVSWLPQQSRWSSTVSILNHRSVYINEICNSEMNDKYLSYLSTTISWHQIASLKIIDPLDLRQLRLLVSKMINLRTLEVYYQFNDEDDADLNKPNLLDLLNDTFLCNMLMSNEFKKLNLHTNWEYPDMIGIAS